MTSSLQPLEDKAKAEEGIQHHTLGIAKIPGIVRYMQRMMTDKVPVVQVLTDTHITVGSIVYVCMYEFIVSLILELLVYDNSYVIYTLVHLCQKSSEMTHDINVLPEISLENFEHAWQRF